MVRRSLRWLGCALIRKRRGWRALGPFLVAYAALALQMLAVPAAWWTPLPVPDLLVWRPEHGEAAMCAVLAASVVIWALAGAVARRRARHFPGAYARVPGWLRDYLLLPTPDGRESRPGG